VDEVPRVAATQAGLFSRRQAYAEGWSSRQVRRRLEAGRWRTVAGVALAAADVEVSSRELAWAVALTWPRAVISHELAGALRRFPIPPPVVGTATVGRDQGLVSPGLLAHRCHLDQRDVSQVLGLPTTTERRTAVDLLAALPADQARRLWAWLSTRGVLDAAGLAAEIQRRPGRPGTPQLRRLLELGASGSLSAGEDLLHQLLREARLTGWTANAPIRVQGRLVAVADVVFEPARVIIEIDGYTAHSGPESFQRDRTRQNALILAGYIVLRFTWLDLTRRPQAVVREIRAALTRGPRPQSAH
jgi:very-short-patch-repair endonuclease